MEEKTEGLLLHAIPYLGTQKILKVFTPESGLLSLITKKPNFSLTTPFCIAEWVYRTGKNEIHLLKDGTLLNDLSDLRQDYLTLSAAGLIAQDLLRSQFPGKKGSGLYALAIAYLKRLSSAPSPLLASFRLKLLLHEGLLALQPECATCGAPALHLAEGESFCPTHSSQSLSFTPQEWDTLLSLAYARQFAPLQSLTLTNSLQEKISKIFEERLKN